MSEEKSNTDILRAKLGPRISLQIEMLSNLFPAKNQMAAKLLLLNLTDIILDESLRNATNGDRD